MVRLKKFTYLYDFQKVFDDTNLRKLNKTNIISLAIIRRTFPHCHRLLYLRTLFSTIYSISIVVNSRRELKILPQHRIPIKVGWRDKKYFGNFLVDNNWQYMDTTGPSTRSYSIYLIFNFSPGLATIRFQSTFCVDASSILQAILHGQKIWWRQRTPDTGHRTMYDDAFRTSYTCLRQTTMIHGEVLKS